jgi:DNA end-binding protein Ku
MPARPIWRGYLRLALVSCPVALWNARHDRSAVRFNMINPETGNRIKMVTTDAETGKELERRDLVKGFEFRKNEYLLLTDDDLNSVKVESSAVMTVEKFVDSASIDLVYYDSSYFLAPDGKAGRDVYAVLREAIAKIGNDRHFPGRDFPARANHCSASNGRWPHGSTLHEDRDLNSPKELFDGMAEIKTDPEMVQLATQLVQRQVGKYESADLEDRYETRLRAIIDAKLKGEGIDTEADVPVEATSNVVDLMAALKNSLSQSSAADAPKGKKAAEVRQIGKKLVVKGGRSATERAEKAPPQAATRSARKRA